MSETMEIETASLPAHVAACSERYRGINSRLKRLELVLYLLLGVLVANGDGPLTEMLGRWLGLR